MFVPYRGRAVRFVDPDRDVSVGQAMPASVAIGQASLARPPLVVPVRELARLLQLYRSPRVASRCVAAGSPLERRPTGQLKAALGAFRVADAPVGANAYFHRCSGSV